MQYQKNLPSDRKTVDDFEYGYKEPERVPKGKCSLRQAMDFLSSHHEDPKEWTAKKIANQYELKEQLVCKQYVISHLEFNAIYVMYFRQYFSKFSHI